MTDNNASRRQHPADPHGELGISVELTEQGHILVVTAHGAIDFWNVGPLQEKLHDTLRAGVTRIVLDLGDVSFVDSTGLGLLVSLDNRTNAENGWLRVADPQPAVRRVMHTTMLDERLQLYSTVEAALSEPEAS